MPSNLNLNATRLHIFHEIRKRRIFVGELQYRKDLDKYELIYDDKYLTMQHAISISPELNLFKKRHLSKKGELFPAFQDRIPSKENPAYEDYCYAQGISIEESNPIILLGSIGRKGPSSFIFEPVYEKSFSEEKVKEFRKVLDVSQNDFAIAFGVSKVTLQKIESGESKDTNTIKLIDIYFEFPEVALWQLKQTGSQLHSRVLAKIVKHFKHFKK